MPDNFQKSASTLNEQGSYGPKIDKSWMVRSYITRRERKNER